MKVFVVSLIALSPVALIGVYAPIPEIEQGHLLSVDLRTGIGYDDNLFGTATNEFDSVIYTVNPSIGINLSLGDQSFFTSKYTLVADYYDNRPTENELYNHKLETGLSYTFSERFTLNVDDELKSVDEPESSLILGSASLQTDQSFWDHDLSIEGLFALSEKTGIVLGSKIYAINYDNADLARLIDRRKNEISFSSRYAFLPEITLIGEARYQEIKYDVDDLNKGSNSLFLLAGANYLMSENFIVQTRLGVESRDRNVGSRKDSFTGNLAGVFSYRENSALTVGLNHQVREASNTASFIDSDVTGLFLSLQHDVTGSNKVFLSGTYIYEAVSLKGRSSVSQRDIDEHVIRFGITLTVKLKENLRLITSFDHDNIRSDETAREQKRNRMSFSIQYQFGGIE